MANEFDELDIRVGDEILTVRAPRGISDADVIAQVQQQIGAAGTTPSSPQTQATSESEEGFLGLPTRSEVESKMAKRTGLERFIGSATLPTLGTIVGGAAGTLTGPAAPVSVPAGAAAGGFLGELLSPEIGLSPRSKAAQVLSAGAPVVGPALGLATKVGGQVTRVGLRQTAPVQAAIARKTLQEMVPEAESLGANILLKQPGMLQMPQGLIRGIVNKIDDVLESSKQLLTRGDLKNSLSAMDDLADDIVSRGLNEMPHGQQALKAIENAKGGLFPSEKPLSRLDLAQKGLTPAEAPFPAPAGTRFDRYLSIRSEVGQSVRALERQAGIKLGSAKKLFSAMAEDLDNVAVAATGPKKRAAILSKKFLERSRLEFAVDDLNEIVSGTVKNIKGEGADVAINAKSVLDKLRSLTNPKDANFDKNFATALKTELPAIRQFFEKANELGMLNPAGPGSLVIRQRFAMLGAGAGGGIGGAVAGTPGAALGAGVGAAIGARTPEYLVGALLSPRGRRALEFAMREGRGTINPQRWATITQIVNQEALAGGREAIRQLPKEPEQ